MILKSKNYAFTMFWLSDSCEMVFPLPAMGGKNEQISWQFIIPSIAESFYINTSFNILSLQESFL